MLKRRLASQRHSASESSGGRAGLLGSAITTEGARSLVCSKHDSEQCNRGLHLEHQQPVQASNDVKISVPHHLHPCRLPDSHLRAVVSRSGDKRCWCDLLREVRQGQFQSGSCRLSCHVGARIPKWHEHGEPGCHKARICLATRASFHQGVSRQVLPRESVEVSDDGKHGDVSQSQKMRRVTSDDA